MERNLRPISQDDAERMLGLVKKHETLFFLPGITIELLAEGLAITPQGEATGLPEDTFTTAIPFEYYAHGRKFFLRLESGQLLVEEEVPSFSTGISPSE